MPKIFKHNNRAKMIVKLCVEVYNLRECDIPKDLHLKLSNMTYQEIIKPMVHSDYVDKKSEISSLAIKYGVTKSVIRSIVICK